MPDPLPEPIPAATLILMRPAPAGGAPEILFTERTQNMAFAAGALVFPGGRIEADDHASAALFAPGLEDGAARVAAIRETIEETGIAPALRPAAAEPGALRKRLAAGEPFAAILSDLGIQLDLAALTPFARWCPNFREARRFDTFFYLAEAPPGAGVTSADRTEAVSAFWASAADVIAEIEAGRAHAIFPTRRNLERLALFASVEEARADAALHPVRKITPWVEERDGRRFVVIPEDAGYPVTAEAYETARRR
ncbi:MAG TPA: NUDIX hydrolase [Allosphingosinicella sp.]|jgi:8-oxo-dGTP pyrophosphatase MutT (NUDIX family)